MYVRVGLQRATGINSSTDGAQCCPTLANCTESLLQLPQPQCANQTWDLYDNNGYFCCLPGLVGYAATLTNTDGCAAAGYALRSGEILLPLISAGRPPGMAPFNQENILISA